MPSDKLRDRFVHRVCNWLINHVATKEYRLGLWAVYLLGRDAIKKMNEQREG